MTLMMSPKSLLAADDNSLMVVGVGIRVVLHFLILLKLLHKHERGRRRLDMLRMMSGLNGQMIL
jgi:hypothetical protein